MGSLRRTCEASLVDKAITRASRSMVSIRSLSALARAPRMCHHRMAVRQRCRAACQILALSLASWILKVSSWSILPCRLYRRAQHAGQRVFQPSLSRRLLGVGLNTFMSVTPRHLVIWQWKHIRPSQPGQGPLVQYRLCSTCCFHVLEPGGAGTSIGSGHGYIRPQPPSDVCLLYTSPSPRDATLSRMPSSA